MITDFSGISRDRLISEIMKLQSRVKKLNGEKEWLKAFITELREELEAYRKMAGHKQ